MGSIFHVELFCKLSFFYKKGEIENSGDICSEDAYVGGAIYGGVATLVGLILERGKSSAVLVGRSAKSP